MLRLLFCARVFAIVFMLALKAALHIVEGYLHTKNGTRVFCDHLLGKIKCIRHISCFMRGVIESKLTFES